MSRTRGHLAARSDPVGVSNHAALGADDSDLKLEITVEPLPRKGRVGAREAAPHANPAPADRSTPAGAQRGLAVNSHRTRADTNPHVVDRAHQLRHRPVRGHRRRSGRRHKHEENNPPSNEARPRDAQAKATRCLLQMHLLRIIIHARLRQKGDGLAAARDCHIRFSAVKGRRLRLVAFGLLLACAATIWASAAAATGQPQHKSQPSLKRLWSAFPLAPKPKSTERQAVTTRPRPPSANGHTIRMLPLAGAAFFALLIVGGVAAVVIRHPRPALAGHPSGPAEGGFLMSNARRRLWGRTESKPPIEQHGDQEGGKPQRVADRLSEYTSIESRFAGPAEDPPARDEPAGDQQAATARAAVETDLAAVGVEVAAVLQSAQEAAATIHRSATEEAARRREELEAELTAEIEQARRSADADRADAQRLRADAEAYATETRDAADTHGEQLRAQAEHEAATIVAEAQSRLDAADAEAERKVREAQAGARARVDVLKAEAERYEERLDNILVVFREMSSQLEELVDGRQQASRESPDDGLEDALRPDSSTTRAA